MKLFGKRKSYSSLRFCTHAVELPLLFDMPAITIAISRVLESQHFPETRSRHSKAAYGLVHSYGFDNPQLPVVINFSSNAPKDEKNIASANVFKVDADAEKHYILQIDLYDPDRSIFESLQKSIERSAISQDYYFHVELRNDYLNLRETRETLPKYTQKAEERRAMLWAVDDGKADLPNLVFDEIVFTDSVTTRAPMWSWDFLNVAGPNAAMYHDPKVAKLRKAMKWPALPETGGQ